MENNRQGPIYFAADEAETTVNELIRKSENWYKNIQFNRYLDRIRRSWAAYHGAYYDESHAISFGGEQGELVNLAVNHYRNLAQHTLVMVTATRPAFQCRSTNTDRKSQVQTKLANSLLDYYMRDKRLEKHLKLAVEYAIALGSGFIKMEWNSTKGEIYDNLEPNEMDIVDYNEDGDPVDINGEVLESIPIYAGDVEFVNLSPFDVVFDSTKETSDQHDWVLCRSFVNKFDIAAKYPEQAEKIKDIPSKDSEYYQKRLTLSPYDKTDDVVVYEFYHKRTESMPNGRYLRYLDKEVVLEDSPMPYRQLPVYRIAPSDILGTPYGYTTMFDLLPIQDALNSLYSTILTNQNAFGVQNILNPRGNDVKVNQLEGGLNFIEYNHQVGAPSALQLTSTPQEIFNFLGMIEKVMETISGVNSVARGNPESSLRSGNALALVQSQALQFMSGLQQSYIQLIEDVGTGLIQLLQDFASTPRIAAIVGISNRTELKEFQSEDISSISRVVVDVGNALMATTAGRAQVAENLLQMGTITKPEQYFQVLTTGNLDTLIESEIDESETIRGENERLINGEDIIAIATDKHSLHIREHRGVLSDQDLRKDPDLVKRTLDHIQEHLNLLRTTDPDLLTAIGEQPLAPQGGAPAAPPQPGMPPGADAQGMAAPMMPTPTSPEGLPQPATPPGEFANLPTDAASAMAAQTTNYALPQG